jgi:small acid-soluble spore protein F (minor alpha/beta-type SASP)
MNNNRGVMSEGLKEVIAKDLGVYNTVQTQGWGAVSSRNCGNLVKMAIEKANRNFQ